MANHTRDVWVGDFSLNSTNPAEVRAMVTFNTETHQMFDASTTLFAFKPEFVQSTPKDGKPFKKHFLIKIFDPCIVQVIVRPSTRFQQNAESLPPTRITKSQLAVFRKFIHEIACSVATMVRPSAGIISGVGNRVRTRAPYVLNNEPCNGLCVICWNEKLFQSHYQCTICKRGFICIECAKSALVGTSKQKALAACPVCCAIL